MLLPKCFVFSTIIVTILSQQLSEWQKEKRNGMQNAKDLDQFLTYAYKQNGNNQISYDYKPNRDNIHKSCSLTDSCVLVSVCEPIAPDVENPESDYYPRCVELTRCVNSSQVYSKYCHPVITVVKKQVVQHKFNGAADYITTRDVSKENHTACHHNTQPYKKFQQSMTSTPTATGCQINRCADYENEELRELQDACNGGSYFNEECCTCDPV